MMKDFPKVPEMTISKDRMKEKMRRMRIVVIRKTVLLIQLVRWTLQMIHKFFTIRMITVAWTTNHIVF